MATSASLQLRDGVWQLRWYDNRGVAKQQSTGIKHDGKFDQDGKAIKPKAALREQLKLEEMLESGKSPEKRTMADLMDLVEADYETRQLRSAPAMKSRVAHIRAFFKQQKASTVTTADLREYAAWRRAGNGAEMAHKNRHNDTVLVRKPVPASNKTIMNEVQLIGKALREADMAVPRFKKLDLPAPRAGFFNDEMLRAVLAYLPEYLRAPVLVGYATGWREGEVVSMKSADVDLKAGEMRAWDQKTEHWKVFPIDVVPTLRALLTPLVESPLTQASSDGVVVHMPLPWLFVRKLKETGEVRRVNEVRKAWDTACIKAGFPGMLFHDLRRSAARNLNNAGWPRQMIKQWCGWATDAMFERYCIQSPTDIQIVRDRMAQVAEIAARAREVR